MTFFCIHCKSRIEASFKACPHCGEPISDFLRRHLDEPVDGKYQILARVAVGGMGEVYKALHIHLNSLRVIKLLRPGSAGDRVANERFMREARLATKINHPNAATLYDFATLDDGSWYMVSEYIEGTNLQELIASRGPLAPRYAAHLAVQALSGLEAIHRAGIIHRDVSPENLMITRTSEGEDLVKVIDLGIAKSMLPEDTSTQAGSFVGKWKYCSPEHLGVIPAGEHIDERADVYSFGAVLYEMLTGVPPFRADSPHEYVILHSSCEPVALREANPTMPPVPELESIVLRALSKDREQRYASAAEMAAALEALLPSLPEGPGARPLHPLSADSTVEATVPGSQLPAGVARRDLEETRALGDGAVRRHERPGRRVRPAIRIAAVLALLVAFGSIATRMMRRPELLARPPAVRNALALAPAAAAGGYVGVNVFPWAQVTRIRNVQSGQIITPAAGEFTPLALELEPGAWEITLVNPSYPEPLVVAAVVVAGSEQVVNAQFVDPRYAAMPDFGGGE